LKMTSWGKRKRKRKSENPRFYGQNKLFLENPTLQSLGNFSHMVACRSSSKNTRKTNLQPSLNKNSPRVHTELGLDVLGVAEKLVKFVVYLSKRKKLKKIMFFFSQSAQTTTDTFLVSRNFKGLEMHIRWKMAVQCFFTLCKRSDLISNSDSCLVMYTTFTKASN
jgi:hypothetical protein